MGTVFKARDRLLDRLVAIKTINLTSPIEDMAEVEARFYQEARAAGGLNHPNIVVIHDVGKIGEIAFMAMEYLEGQELRALLSRRGALPAAEAVSIAAQVAEGLSFAHARGVIHRDIKPSNIMIGRDGRAKITDFGIARLCTSEIKTMTGAIFGSPRYISPEQVSGRRADHRSDIFALGVVLYEMLAGEPPFQANNLHGLMYQTMNAEPPAPSSLRPAIPPILDFVVAKALAKSADTRYQHAREFAEDLRASVEEGRASAVEQRIRASLARPASPRLPESETGRAGGDSSAPAPAGPVILNLVASPPAYTLSRAFDSTDATMRLVSLGSRPVEQPAKQAPSLGAQLLAESPAFSPTRLTKWLWAVAAFGTVATVGILLLR